MLHSCQKLRKLIIRLLVWGVCFSCVPVRVFAATPAMPVPASSQAVIMETGTPQLLCGSGQTERIAPGSLVSYLIMLTAVEHARPTDKITVPSGINSAVPRECDIIYLAAGEVLTVEDCLKGMMFYSANDAAYTLAAGIAGSEKVFVGWMNELAKSLGCTDSHFASVFDLDRADQYATVQDIACILSAFRRSEYLFGLYSQDLLSIAPTNKTEETRYYPNTFALLQTISDDYYENATGGSLHGKHVVSFAEDDSMSVVCVIANTASSEEAEKAAHDLAEYALQYYRQVTVSYGEASIARLPVYHGDKKLGYADIIVDGELQYFAEVLSRKPSDPEGLDVFFTHTVTLPERLEAPLSAGDKVGQVVYTLRADPSVQATLSLAVKDAFPLPDAEGFEESVPETVSHIGSVLDTIPLLLIPLLLVVILILLKPWVLDKLRSRRK